MPAKTTKSCKTMEELEKTARELILAITEKTLKSLKDKGLLKEPSKLQMLCSSPEMKSLIKKLSTPKYDPNRKFRKGDIVKPCQVKGRWQSITWKGCSGIHFTVTEDEDEDGIVSIKDPDCKLPSITSAVFLELVTPVEELEPYTISEGAGIIEVYNEKREAVKAWFYDDVKAGVKALAEAEAERDRLSDEWRKEQRND